VTQASRAPLTPRQIRIVYFGLMLGLMVASLDQTIVATALPTIAGDLGGLNHISWVISAYLLAATTTTLVYGKLGDLYGRKIIFQVAIVIFLLGSVMSGIARSMSELIVFRGIQGLGAGGIFPQVMAIIGDIISPRMRAKYQGYMNAVFTVSAISGPAIGGLFTEHLSWRWCFYVNVPIGGVALVVTSVVLNLPFTRVRHQIDYLGAALLSCAVTAFLLVTVWAGNTSSWASPEIVGTLCAVVVLAGMFVLQERRSAEPLLPLGLWRNSTFRIVNITGFLAMMALTGTIAYLPLFLQLVTGILPTLSGLLLVPESLSLTLCSVIVGRRVAKTGRYKRYPVMGAIVTPLGVFLLSTMTQHTGRWVVSLYMIVLGAGLGLMLTVIVVALQNAVSQRDMGTATASYMFFRSIGSAFGAALYGTIMNARLQYWLPRLLPAGQRHRVTVSSLSYSPAAVRHLPDPVKAAVIESFGHSLHIVFLLAAPVAAIAFPLLLSMRELPLRTAAHIEAAPAEAGQPLAPAPAEAGQPAEVGQPAEGPAPEV
jgi:EmrB/QacA subfamily drug resistance transporter